ncbi:ABC transporter permease [Hymenobacter lutimineralis]|uniref:Heme exporter protein C n=1 Tax=Hymenobacter lutimineralis TaxID=2606448 RepID=A0A5D6V5H2_9BACT|nr:MULTISPECIES: cytochrome c biogenesis protein CcsA [Hymenobacter]QIX62132.1 cytochrome c biogenesis protein CcsA [Hymenobacter sp. BT18]TYZ10149.1 ABC transporter permease [Hymenobacter lutimineralis]
MAKNWWKALTVLLLLYTAVAGLLLPVPRLAILNETIRNLYFHVPMWFGMTIILLTSVVFSIRYLRNPSPRLDTLSHGFAQTGILMGLVGLATGSLWARFTWGTWWTNDPKLNGAAIAMLIYGAYLVLRSSFADDQQRARVSAIYNIFAFAAAMPLFFILPRLTDSLHPGAGGNPAFAKYDLDSNMRLVFYPAVIGWTLLGVWITQLSVRLSLLKQHVHEKQLA